MNNDLDYIDMLIYRRKVGVDWCKQDLKEDCQYPPQIKNSYYIVARSCQLPMLMACNSFQKFLCLDHIMSAYCLYLSTVCFFSFFFFYILLLLLYQLCLCNYSISSYFSIFLALISYHDQSLKWKRLAERSILLVNHMARVRKIAKIIIFFKLSVTIGKKIRTFCFCK